MRPSHGLFKGKNMGGRGKKLPGGNAEGEAGQGKRVFQLSNLYKCDESKLPSRGGGNLCHSLEGQKRTIKSAPPVGRGRKQRCMRDRRLPCPRLWRCNHLWPAFSPPGLEKRGKPPPPAGDKCWKKNLDVVARGGGEKEGGALDSAGIFQVRE